MKLFLFFLLLNSAFAQTNLTIRAGRPGQAIGAFVVGKNYFQIQSGIDHNWQDGKNLNQNNLLRYGLSERVEFQTSVAYQKGVDRSFDEGISDLRAGFRYTLIEKQNGLIPVLGLQARTSLPYKSHEFQNNHFSPGFLVTAFHQLNSRFTFEQNYSLVYSEALRVHTYNYVYNLSFGLVGNLSSFVEAYGTYQNELAQLNFDTGLAYLLSNDLQLDVYGGGGENHGQSSYFISAGVSWRQK
ncbi:MAG: transporter [Bacteriovoracaceae bacterium]|nr:transporter [Bacteriovoracaceae bacterium]